MNKAIDIKTLKGLTQDSRAVKKGYLFAALPGSKFDGRSYIDDALRNGAVAVLAPKGTKQPDDAQIVFITDDNPRRALALMAAEFYGLQPGRIAAVTGTNGKTSTVHFIKQLWAAHGLKAASIGTLGVRGLGQVRSSSMTTPDPVALHAELADLAAAGVTHLAMEASSHGLHQYRLDGVKVAAAGFTNFTRDHLDYHADMESYFEAKARLFSEILGEGGMAVLNADIPEFETLKKIVKGRGCKVLCFGFKAKDLKILEAVPTPQGQKLKLEILGKIYELTLPVVGGFQVMNALCALGLVISEDMNNQKLIAEYANGLAKLQGPPGRLQLVPGHPQKAAVYIDYAHTPDALETVLKALKPHTQGKLVCLFGCGGDRDRGKRPIMGKIASEFADRVIVTDDNPRSEDPASIRKAILETAKGAQEIGNRHEAISTAIKSLKVGDVLVIAGKGHEQGQIFAGHTDPFDDYSEAEKIITRNQKIMTPTPILWTSLEAAVITGGKNTCEWQATGVCLNAADVQPGDLFFAGEADDLNEVFLKGAAAAVVPKNVQEKDGWPLLKVIDVFEALRGLARASRFKTHAQVVAVQGQAARGAITEILSSAFDVYKGRRHLSLGLAGMPEICDFAVFGFSPLIRPDIAVVTDCKNVDGSVFETMAPSARILIHADAENVADVVALARASGIRNIFTYGRAKDADAVLLETLHAANGVRVRLRVLGEDCEMVLPIGESASPEMLAGALILKLSEVSAVRIAAIFSKEQPGMPGAGNLTLMDRLIGNPAQAAFRVLNMIDRGNGKRMVILDNVSVAPQISSVFSNKELDIPLKVDNLELVYACKEVSLFSNAEAAIQQVRPAAALGKIVPSVLGPGDFLTFKGLLGGSKNLISGAMRLMPQAHGKKA